MSLHEETAGELIGVLREIDDLNIFHCGQVQLHQLVLDARQEDVASLLVGVAAMQHAAQVLHPWFALPKDWKTSSHVHSECILAQRKQSLSASIDLPLGKGKPNS